MNTQPFSTPRTDSIASQMKFAYYNQPAIQRAIDFASQLERELNEAKNVLETISRGIGSARAASMAKDFLTKYNTK